MAATLIETAAADADAAQGSRSRYLRNLAALYGCDPALAARIEATPFAAGPTLEAARDGTLTARVRAADGKELYLHSRYRPVDEAAEFVTKLLAGPGSTDRHPTGSTTGRRTNGTEDEAPTDPAEVEHAAVLLGGIGLGYHLVELESRLNRPLLIVAEPDLGLIKTALAVADLTQPLRDGRLLLFTGIDKAELHRRLQPLATALLLGLRHGSLAYAARCAAEFHADVLRLVLDFLSFSRVQMYSLVRNGRTTCRNIAFNLPHYLARPGVEVLAGRAQGYPAILVAAGPALARNIDQLAALRDRAVIIAVQTVYKTLLARGISPHFVTSLDFHEISAQFFHGAGRNDKTILVAEPKAHCSVLDTFGGRTHVLHASFADDLLRESGPQRASLKAGSTVAHLSFYLAQHLGCDPIVLVGQDLSFSDGLYYPPGMQIERIWQPELSRFQTIEMKQWERIVRARHILRKVKDIHGRDVYTDDQLFTYAEQFQADFLESKQRVVHAVEGGMKLAGVETMTLRMAAEQYCTRDLPADLFGAGGDPEPAELRERAAAALRLRVTELGELRELAMEMRRLLNRLVELLDRPGEFNTVVVRVDELRTRIQRMEDTYRLVQSVSQFAELRRVHADRQLGDHEMETRESARRRLRRDREFVAEFIEGCEYLLTMLPQALARLDGNYGHCESG